MTKKKNLLCKRCQVKLVNEIFELKEKLRLREEQHEELKDLALRRLKTK